MSLFLNLLISGILIGASYALIGMAVTLLVGVIGIIDFSQGAWVIFSMYVAYQLATWLGVSSSPAYYAVALLTVGIAYGIGLGVYQVVLRPILNSGGDSRQVHLRQLVVTIGVSLVLSSSILMIWTNNAKYIGFTQTIALGGNVNVSVASLIAGVGAMLVAGLVAALLYRTNLGMRIRAVTDDPQAAQMFGVNRQRIARNAYALALAVSAAAGVLIAPTISIVPTAGLWYLLVGSGVMAVAAFKSLRLAIVGGLLVGVLTSLSLLRLDGDFQPVLAFAVIIAALIYRYWAGVFRLRRLRTA